MPRFIAYDHLAAGDLSIIRQAIGDGGLSGVGTDGSGQGTQSNSGRIWYKSRERNINSWIVHPIDDDELFACGARCILGWSGAPAADVARFFEITPTSGTTPILYIDNNTGVAQTGRVVCNGVVLGTFALPTFATQSFIEVAMKVSAAADGWVVVKVAGAEVLRATAIQTTAGPTAAGMLLSGIGAASNVFTLWTDQYTKAAVDDVDAPGFYGPILMRRLLPTADVSAQFTPSTGVTNYDLIDETTLSTADYVESNTLGHEDQYEVEDLPAGINSIIAVVVCSMALAPNGGAPAIEHAIEVSGTKVYGEDKAIGLGAVAMAQTVFTTAPDASVWTAAKVDGMRVGRRAA